MLLPETDEIAAESAAERLRGSFEQAEDILPGQNLKVTVSIGVREDRLSVPSYEAMLKRADEANYEVKRPGRNRVLRGSLNLVPVNLVVAAE